MVTGGQTPDPAFLNTLRSAPAAREIVPVPEILSTGEKIVRTTRGSLGALAEQVGHNTVTGAAGNCLPLSAALAGSLLTGAFVWKGLDIMARGKEAVPFSKNFA